MKNWMKRTVITALAACLLIGYNPSTSAAAAKEKVTSLTRVSPLYSTCTVAKGKTLYLKVKVAPDDAENQDLKWTTSNKRIVTVSATGRVKGIRKGTATIKAATKDGSKLVLSWKVKVGIPTTGIATKEDMLSLTTGDAYQLGASVKPASASNKALVYSSADKEIASVSKDGVVTAHTSGNTKIVIRAKDGRSSKTIPVTVKLKKNDRYITSKDVNGSLLVVSNETYDDLYIDGSVGNVNISFYNVTVNGTLYMGDGGIYKLDLNNSKIANVKTTSETSYKVSRAFPNFSITPTLISNNGSTVGDVEIVSNMAVQRLGTGTIGNISITLPDSVSSQMVDLNGLKGSLSVDAKKGNVTIDMASCQFETVSSTGSVTIGDGVSPSNLKDITMAGTGSNLVLDVTAVNLTVSSESFGNTITISKPIGTFYNYGRSSTAFISSFITTIRTAGMAANLSAQPDGGAGTIYVEGLSTYLKFPQLSPTQKTTVIVSPNVSGTIFNDQAVEAGKTMTN